MADLTDSEIIQRGEHARALLENEDIMGGLRRMSERITLDWRNASRSAPTLRDELHAQVAAIDALVSLWKRDVDDAKFLAAKLAKAAAR